MKKFIFILLIILQFTLLTNCEKEILVQRIPKDLPEFTQLPQVTNVQYSSADILWSVNEPCTTRIQYWIPGNTDTFSISDNEYRQNHEKRLLGLEDNTQYNFQIMCANRYEYSVVSDIFPFRTIFDYTGFISNGWASFESEDYDSAQYYFTEYLAYIPLSFEALSGAGWTFCQLNMIDSATKYFDKALVAGSDDDVITGKTINSYKSMKYTQSITYGKILHNKALNYWADNWETYNPVDSAFYVFQHDSSFDNLDIALILADSYYQTLDYSASKTVINMLYPNSGIHPLLPNSWHVNSTTYDNYEDALGALIDSLKGAYWENGQFPE